MRMPQNNKNKIIESLVFLLFLSTSINVFAATTDYSVRVRAFAKYGPNTHQPDPLVFQNSTTVGAALSATAAAGFPTTYGAASLRSGSNRGVVAVIGDLPGGEFGQGSFNAEYRDYVTFDLPDGMTTATIKAIVDLTGTIESNPGLNGGLIENWQVNASLTFGGSNEGGIIAQDGLFDYSEPLFTHELSSDWEVTDGQPVYVSSFLSASADATSANILLFFDLPDSNMLRFEMPEGTSFSSASGVFLTAVPVPAPLILFCSGLLALIGRGTRATGQHK